MFDPDADGYCQSNDNGTDLSRRDNTCNNRTRNPRTDLLRDNDRHIGHSRNDGQHLNVGRDTSNDRSAYNSFWNTGGSG